MLPRLVLAIPIKKNTFLVAEKLGLLQTYVIYSYFS